jgi:hypothetical protein
VGDVGKGPRVAHVRLRALVRRSRSGFCPEPIGFAVVCSIVPPASPGPTRVPTLPVQAQSNLCIQSTSFWAEAQLRGQAYFVHPCLHISRRSSAMEVAPLTLPSSGRASGTCIRSSLRREGRSKPHLGRSKQARTVSSKMHPAENCPQPQSSRMEWRITSSLIIAFIHFGEQEIIRTRITLPSQCYPSKGTISCHTKNKIKIGQKSEFVKTVDSVLSDARFSLSQVPCSHL